MDKVRESSKIIKLHADCAVHILFPGEIVCVFIPSNKGVWAKKWIQGGIDTVWSYKEGFMRSWLRHSQLEMSDSVVISSNIGILNEYLMVIKPVKEGLSHGCFLWSYYLASFPNIVFCSIYHYLIDDILCLYNFLIFFSTH